MGSAEPTAGFDRELTGFYARLLELREGHATDNGDLDTAVRALESAADQLRGLHDSLTSRVEGAAARQTAADRERHLLRAVFRDLPFAVLLLDRDGRVRRTNRRAHDLLGVNSDYVSGKPFAVFLDVADRSSFRIRLSIVLRQGEAQTLSAALLHSGRRIPSRLALTAVELPSDPRPLIAVVAVPTGPPAGNGASTGAAAEGERVTTAAEGLLADTAAPVEARSGPQTGPDSDEIRSQARGGDTIGDVTRILLEETGGPDGVVLQRAAGRLATGFADWVVIDVLRDGTPTRAVVASPAAERDSLLTQAVERADVRAAPLPCQVIASGESVLVAHLEDMSALGADERAVAFLGAVGAHSVLSAPIVRRGQPIGALTLARTGTTDAFRLAEQAAAQELGELLGHVLRLPDAPAAASGSTTEPEPFLPQRTLTASRLDIAWMHMPGKGGTAPFLDFYDQPDGWGAAIGSAAIGGVTAQSHVAMVRQWALLLGSAGLAPADVLAQMDDGLRRLRPGEPPVSAAVLRLSEQDGRLTVAIGSAGHRSSLWLRTDGRVQRTDGGGQALNAPEGPSSHHVTDLLVPGDCMLFYTNELPEVANEAGQSFGGSGELANSLARTTGQPSRRVIEGLTASLTAFASGQHSDAIVAVAIRYTPDGP